MSHQSGSPAQPPRKAFSDYQRYFLKFEAPSHSIIAVDLTLSRNSEQIEQAQNDFDRAVFSSSESSEPRPLASLLTYPASSYRGLYQPKVREVMESLQGSSQNPVDLTTESGTVRRCGPRDLLDAVVIRHLHFAEDVRPPYCGSYTKISEPRQKLRLQRAPFRRLRKDTNYDYDSEAEWEEPEEGEDLDSDAEDDAESVDSADEMDGFLEDDTADRLKRNFLTTEMVPVSTGLCWADASGKTTTPENADGMNMASMKLDWLLDMPVKSINPFSTEYWEMETAAPLAAAAPTKADGTATLKWPDGLMKPPRVPLQPRTNSSNAAVIVGAASGEKGPIMAVSGSKAAKHSAPRLQGEDLAQFKDAVVGSNLTQIELLKALKSRYDHTFTARRWAIMSDIRQVTPIHKRHDQGNAQGALCSSGRYRCGKGLAFCRRLNGCTRKSRAC